VPSDQIAKLVDVSDYDKGENKRGWKFTYEVLGAKFDEYISFNSAARWKLIQVAQAHGYPIEQGVNNIDPNLFVGTEVGARIDWEKDPSSLAEGESNYRTIKYLFPLSDEEEEAAPTATGADAPDVL
jgi:hypothetical protein